MLYPSSSPRFENWQPASGAPFVKRPSALRILHLNSILRSGGTDLQSISLAEGLLQLEQDVWMAGPDGRPFSAVCRERGIPFVPIHREGPLKLAFIVEAARIIRNKRIQIVHGHHGRDYWRTALAARLSGVRPKVVLHRYLAKSLGTWVSRRFLLNRTDAFIATSGCVCRILTQGIFEPDSPEPERRARPSIHGDHQRIRIIYGGVDVGRFYPRSAASLRREWGLSPEHVAFAVVAGYPKPRGKGQREFLAAAARIRQQHPEARFLLVGRGELEDTLREDIARLQLGDCTRLTSWCEDMPAVMNAIDCLVHPQVGTDAFPTVILEAMACAKPVIATRIDGAVEQVVHGETGLIVEPEDIGHLARAMTTVLNEGRSLRSQFGNAGRDRVCAHFDSRLLAHRVLALYRELCPGPMTAQESEVTGGRRGAAGLPLTAQPSVSETRR